MKKSLAVPLCLALAAASFAVAGTATALEHPSHRALLSLGGDSGPSGLLVRKAVGGRAAITELGSNLDEVAAASGMSTARLTRILTTDPTARIFPAGRLAYVDPARPSSVSAEPPVAQAQFPDSQTFTLHSRPGSDHVIYLDFNGATVSGTAWNTGADAVPNAFYDGFTLDGDTSTYTPTEHTYVQEVWRMVAETYKTFDVDVTTADPGVAAYNRTDANDPTYGDHVLITDDPDSYPACDPTGGCAGVAFVGTFDNAGEPTDKYEPEWVHPSQYAFDTATTISHEVGHTLGLSHDGVTGGSAYYAGQGNWSPIMGSGPNAVQQFSIGDYANANNTEDDLAVISAHGLPRIADEAGDTLAAALDLGAQTSYARTGLISTRSDADYYKISHPCSTDLTVSASGSGVGSALDLRWDLYDASGNQLDFSDPVSSQSNDVLPVATGMDAPAKTHAAPVGTYYVKVDGVGKGNPLTTGYSDYGSVGSYALSVSGCSG
ncbi:MAG: zinc-dependent metalloprotease family protein, partial [Marmoricola sp.]